ncbi:hypothetical protein [Streptomyces sp. NBC_00306]|nr:hypothetical protein [Streptomyces sp. NBC_00306]
MGWATISITAATSPRSSGSDREWKTTSALPDSTPGRPVDLTGHAR